MLRRAAVGSVARRHLVLTCLLALAVSCLPGCSGPSTGLPVYSDGSQLPPSAPAYPTVVQIKYLGAGGMLIQRGNDMLMTAPFFSNPSIPRVAFGEIRPLPEQINRFVGPNSKDPTDLTGVTAVLVGHAHYDHLMDVPYVKKNYLPQAKIYGSETMKNTLAAVGELKPDVVSVEQDPKWIGTADKPGKWWPAGPRVRFMALKSEHAPILAHIKLFEGEYQEPLQELPTRASGWREGHTLAYLIDFLGADGKTVDFRVHYQDAASTAPLGFPPLMDQLDDPRPVDLAIVCMPGFDQVKNYPEAIVERLKPRFVLIIHWENFFDLLPDDPRQLRTVPTEHAERFMTRLHDVATGSVITLPAQGAWMRFSP